MPWLSLPCDSSLTKTFLKAYQIKTIPSFVIIDRHGGIISRQARQEVYTGTYAYTQWRSGSASPPPEDLLVNKGEKSCSIM